MYCDHVGFGISCGMDYVIQTPLQLASHLRALRKARGLSQAALGHLLGVGQARVARIEGDPTAISVEQLIEVLAALNVRLVLRDTHAPPAADAAPATKAPKRRATEADW
jgi:HTH-type transcriptional regulator/antitoxin HipB